MLSSVASSPVAPSTMHDGCASQAFPISWSVLPSRYVVWNCDIICSSSSFFLSPHFRLELYHQSSSCRGLRLTSVFLALLSPSSAFAGVAILHHKSDYITPLLSNFQWLSVGCAGCSSELAGGLWAGMNDDIIIPVCPHRSIRSSSFHIWNFEGNENSIYIKFVWEIKEESNTTSFGFCPFCFVFAAFWGGGSQSLGMSYLRMERNDGQQTQSLWLFQEWNPVVPSGPPWDPV